MWVRADSLQPQVSLGEEDQLTADIKMLLEFKKQKEAS